VVNRASDTGSVDDLDMQNVVAALDTDDDSCDVVFARGKAYVSYSQANTVLVSLTGDRDGRPRRDTGPHPHRRRGPVREGVGPNGEVLVAIFESGAARPCSAEGSIPRR
jgi:hypothetical protein